MAEKWGVTILMASEKRQRELAQQWSPDSVQAEYVPFSFRLNNDGEEMRPAPFATLLTFGTGLSNYWMT